MANGFVVETSLIFLSNITHYRLPITYSKSGKLRVESELSTLNSQLSIFVLSIGIKGVKEGSDAKFGENRFAFQHITTIDEVFRIFVHILDEK